MLARTHRTTRTTLAGLLLIGLAATAHADTPSYTVTDWDIEPASGAFTLGYTFVPSQNIVVTAMGEWVPFGGVISGSENTGIFDNNDNLLFSALYDQASATITSNTLPGGSQFRYVDVTALPLSQRTLTAGNTYTYAATILNNSIATGAQGLTPGPGITITSGGLFSNGDTLSGPSPTAPNGNVGFNMYGVNFEYSTSGVTAATPEPGTWALLGGLIPCSLGLLRRRRSKSA